METFDIREHVFVPSHSLASSEEVAHILEKYSITLKQLPCILDSDPLVKHLSAQPGDVIKVERESQTAGKTIFLRVVIHG